MDTTWNDIFSFLFIVQMKFEGGVSNPSQQACLTSTVHLN